MFGLNALNEWDSRGIFNRSAWNEVFWTEQRKKKQTSATSRLPLSLHIVFTLFLYTVLLCYPFLLWIRKQCANHKKPFWSLGCHDAEMAKKKKIESLWLKCRNHSSVPHLEGFKCSFDVNLLYRWCVTVHIQYVTWGRWEIGFIFYFACLNIAWWKVCCCCFQFILAWLVLNILRFLWI